MDKIKSIALIGRGAIGTLFAMLWQEAVEMAFLVDADRKRKYEKDPLVCNGKKVSFKYVSDISEFHPVDYIFISTKYSGLHTAMRMMNDFVKEDTIIVSALNGIQSEEILRKQFPKNNVVRTIVQGMDSTYLNNEVTYHTVGQLLFGQELDTEARAVQLLEEFYQRTNISYKKCDDIIYEQWNKLMLNCGLNQTCAAYYATYGGVKVEGVLQDIFLTAMREVKEIANAQGIRLSEKDMLDWLNVLKPLSPEGMPSMRQDIIAHRKTELDLFSGTILPMAEKLQIDVPVLKDLYGRIQKIEASFDEKI